MGSKFFQPSRPKIAASGLNMAARAIGSSGYAGRGAAMGASKDIAAASALNKAQQPLKKTDRSAAYAPGPKRL